jgi:hypothetical protein
MKFEVGDIVVVNLTNEQGHIVEILNEKMVILEVRGVQFPTYIDQLDFPYFRNFTKHLQPGAKKEQKPVPKTYIDDVPKDKKKAIPKQIEQQGVFLHLYPKFIIDFYGDEVVELFKIFIVNQTDAGYQFTFDQKFFGRSNFDLTNTVEPYHDFYVFDVKFEDFSDSPSIEILFSLINPQDDKVESHNTILKFKGKTLFEAIEKMKLKNEPCLKYKLFKTYPLRSYDYMIAPPTSLKILEQGIKAQKDKAKKSGEAALSVVDLHIEKITDNITNLTNGEIVMMQMSHFEKYLNLAIKNKLENFIVIHGIGNGTLKNEVHQFLKFHKGVNFFINQYDPRFGFGATEIFLKKGSF